jgi:hypothetical protein
VATFHSGKQGELEDVTEHLELKLSRVIGKGPAYVVELKTPWEPSWDPTRNLTFWYQEVIALGFCTHEDDITQFER